MAQTPSQAPEPQRSYREILAAEIQQGLREHHRSNRGLFMSGLSAGLDLSISLFIMAVALTLVHGVWSEALSRLLTASLYTVGFIFVVIGRSELFTEHTALAVLPVLNRRTTLGSLLRLWALVYAGNVLGAIAFTLFAVYLGPALGVIEDWAFSDIAAKLLNHSSPAMLASAVLAGWLMGLLSWLVAAARDTISQIIIIWLITFCIGLAHLPHSILGTSEVLAGVLVSDTQGWEDLARFMLLATLGNAMGGAIFVALIKYGHAKHSSPEEQE